MTTKINIIILLSFLAFVLSDILGATDSKWNSVAVSANSATSLSLSGLGYGGYKVYQFDASGNKAVASSTGTIGTGVNLLQATGSYSLGAGKGYLIDPFISGGKTYAVWSANNDGAWDNVSTAGLSSLFGFGNAPSSTPGAIANPNQIVLNGVTIKLLSTWDNTASQASGGIRGDAQTLFNALDSLDGVIDNNANSKLLELGWSTGFILSSQSAPLYEGSDMTYVYNLKTGYTSWSDYDSGPNNSLMVVFQVM